MDPLPCACAPLDTFRFARVDLRESRDGSRFRESSEIQRTFRWVANCGPPADFRPARQFDARHCGFAIARGCSTLAGMAKQALSPNSDITGKAGKQLERCVIASFPVVESMGFKGRLPTMGGLAAGWGLGICGSLLMQPHGARRPESGLGFQVPRPSSEEAPSEASWSSFSIPFGKFASIRSVGLKEAGFAFIKRTSISPLSNKPRSSTSTRVSTRWSAI
jgi:hypothetical protein